MATKIKLIADNVITTSQIDTSSLDSHFTGGTGVTYSSGTISIGQAVHSTDSPTFADLTITGNLNITGDINSYNVTDLDVTDQTITLGAGQTEALSGGSGIIVDGSNASILWDETTDGWVFNKQIGVNADDCTTASSLSNIVVGEYADASSGIVLRGTTASALNFEDNSSVTAARVYYNHASGYMAFNTEQTERMRIDSSGNVGIGTDNPSPKFHVYQATGELTPRFEVGDTSVVGLRLINSSQHWRAGIQSTSNYVIRDVTNNRNTFSINGSDGNVGIGTTNPYHKLSVNGTLGSSTFSGFGLGVVGGIATAESDDTNRAIGIQATNSTNSKLFSYDYTNSAGIPISIQPDNADVYLCANGGSVGIGNTGPTSKLHLGNSSTSGGLGLGIQNNSRYYTINTDGGDLIVKDESAASKRVTIESVGSLSHWDNGQFTRRRIHFNQGLSTYQASDMTADSDQEAPWVGFNDLGIVSLRGFAPYIDIKTNYTANNLMFMFKFEGYLYNRGNSVFYGGGYTYNNTVIAKDIGATQAILGPAYVYQLYRASSDSALCIKIHANVANATYDEGKIAVSLFTFGELSTFRIASVRITDSTSNYY